MLMASPGAASSTTPQQKDAKPAATTVKPDEAQPNPRFVRTLTNVQVELNLTDQIGAEPAEKKTVTMIVSSGNWGKIQSQTVILQSGKPMIISQAADPVSDRKVVVEVKATVLK